MAQSNMGPRFRIGGVTLDASSFDTVVQRLLEAPDRGEHLAVHFATAHSIVEADRDPAVRAALEADLVEPDGVPLVWLGRRAGLDVERVCGPDMMPALIAAGVGRDRSHLFLGGEPGVAERLAARFRARHPGLRVVGTISPPFRELTPEEDAALCRQIDEAEPDYVWVGLGSPKQDLWVASHRPRLRAPVLLAVGAAFDFHAGRVRRAPRLMQRTGTEWLFRLAMEPRRLFGRYTGTNLRFAALVLAGARTHEAPPPRRDR